MFDYSWGEPSHQHLTVMRVLKVTSVHFSLRWQIHVSVDYGSVGRTYSCKSQLRQTHPRSADSIRCSGYSLRNARQRRGWKSCLVCGHVFSTRLRVCPSCSIEVRQLNIPKATGGGQLNSVHWVHGIVTITCSLAVTQLAKYSESNSLIERCPYGPIYHLSGDGNLRKRKLKINITQRKLIVTESDEKLINFMLNFKHSEFDLPFMSCHFVLILATDSGGESSSPEDSGRDRVWNYNRRAKQSGAG